MKREESRVINKMRRTMSKDKKYHGKTNIPSVIPSLAAESPYPHQNMCSLYGVPSEMEAKRKRMEAFKNDRGTFAHIAVENLSNIISARTDKHRRDELIKAAAVLIDWAEQIQGDVYLD